jgi:threonine/homoserine/homoserine lactone efflux protein
MLSNVLAFLGACVLIAMVPGPSTAVILRQAVRDGRRAALLTTLGNETGVVGWGVAAALGLTALVTASQIAYDTIRVLGAIFLVVLGVQSLLAARRAAPATAAPAATAAGTNSSGWHAYRVGVATIAANPKAAVFAMSFLPQFVPAGVPVLPALVTLAVVWGIVDLLWYGLLIWFVGRARAVFSRAAVRRRLEQVSGAVLVALGVRLAVEDV